MPSSASLASRSLSDRANGSPQHPTYSILYAFKGKGDGNEPHGGVVRDSSGNLYGATALGGRSNFGVIFKLSPTGRMTTLHSFTGGADGAYPSGNLVLDAQANLYGTTSEGGNAYPSQGCGAVYELRKTGKLTVLRTFKGVPDGCTPEDGLAWGDSGYLYGTTNSGGISGGNCQSTGCGVVFKLNAKRRTETILYRFSGGADGGGPVAAVVRDSLGHLYGTTVSGGSFVGGGNGSGVVFELSGTRERVLHAFTGHTYGGDGQWPAAPVVLTANGTLFGSTDYGGASGWGTIFRVSAGGAETVLYSFTGLIDGAGPISGLVRDSLGNLYGTANQGGGGCGIGNCGIVFEFDPSGAETILHDFRGQEGAYPFAGLFRDRSGTLFGTTSEGGPYGYGVVFELTPTNDPVNH